MTAQKQWHAKETAIVIGPTVSSVGTTGTVYAHVVAASGEAQLESVAKNVIVTEPEGSIDIENFIGVDSGSFQNAEVSYKPYTMGSITGTLIVTDAVKVEPWFMGTTATSITNGLRYQPGCFASGKERQAIAIGVLLSQVGALNSTTKSVSLTLNNAVVTKLGDYKLSGADGTWEVDFEAKCLPRDFYVEFLAPA